MNTKLFEIPNLWKRVRLVVVRPMGHGPNNPVTEAMDCLAYAFEKLGASVDIAHNEFILDGINILFFSFFITAQDAIPPNTIIFNVDQIDDNSIVLPKDYIDQIGKFLVWDYSQRNIERIRLKNRDIRIQRVDIGYAPVLTRITPAANQDIDVLFYGALNARRKHIIDELITRGFNVVSFDTAYGPERDQYIGRAKVVLNIHYYEAKIFEIFRVSYLLANSKAVVSECGEGTEIDTGVLDGIFGVSYDKLVDACAELVHDEAKRKSFESRGFEVFKQRDQTEILKTLIAESPYSLPLPKSINLGSGKSWSKDALNMDINPMWKPDILFDVSDPALLEKTFVMERFGTQTIPSSYFDSILAMDVLEHVPDLVSLMSNCLKLLKNGGEMQIGVPYDLSYGAWQDPTHIRAFNEKSWLYYTDWHWYIGWIDARFDLIRLNFVLSDFGQTMLSEGSTQSDLIRTPRAVDSMNVVLRKRLLTRPEIERATQLHRGDRQ